MAHLTLTGKEPTKRVNKYIKYHCFGALGRESPPSRSALPRLA